MNLLKINPFFDMGVKNEKNKSDFWVTFDEYLTNFL